MKESNSGVFVFPRRMAPASFTRFTTVVSFHVSFNEA